MRRKCLLIEDSRTVGQLMSRTLASADVDVIWSQSLEQARGHLQGEKPQVVLLDLLLPGASGAVGVRQVRESWPSASVVAMTGGDSSRPPNALLAEARDAGAGFLLAKPFLPQVLMDTVSDAHEVAVHGPMKGHVMVVDDSRTVLAFARKALFAAKYRPSTAGSMEAAMESLLLPTLDCIVTDIFMAGVGGLHGVTHFRKHWPGIGLVAMSGGAEARGEEANALKAAAKIGADATLMKPFAQEALAAAVETARACAAARSGKAAVAI